MPQTKVRVVGSNFTTFRWNGKAIAFLESFTDSGQTPIVAPAAIHPLDSKFPVEYATPRAMNGGSLQMTIRELWNAPVWQQLTGLQNANDIIDIWETVAADPTTITCQTIIKPPQGNIWRVKTYHNVLITDIDDSETVSIESLSVPRQIGAVYTHATRSTIVAGSV